MSRETSCSCCLRTTDAGCSRAAARCTQSLGQLISIRRLVPQHTVQIVCPIAGHARRGFRRSQTGQAMSSASHTPSDFPYNPAQISRISSEYGLQPGVARESAAATRLARADTFANAAWRTMAEALFRNESPTEFFRELVETAMQNQRVSAQELTSFYVVNLLTAFVHFETSPAAGDDGPLGVRLARAMQTAGIAQRDGLRKVGDLSLFISGFFSDSLNRRLVDVDYYIQLGECAYGSLARRDEALGEVFDELSEKFTAFVDILGEVSERTALTSNADVLRL